MRTLVIAEHQQNTLHLSTLNTVSAATKLGHEISLLVIGHQCDSVAQQAACISAASQVMVADHEAYAHPLAENIAPLILRVAKDFNYILAPATTFGKNILPRVAALLDVAQISEVIEVIDGTTFKRPIYAGNAIATVKSNDLIKVMTIRSTAFPKTATAEPKAPIQKLEVAEISKQVQFVKLESSQSDRPELTSARVVISGGRGLASGENFTKYLEPVAKKLNAAIGASRVAVDSGYVPNDYQVGQTGKVVAPELYIAVGISGAIQHLAGMKDSKIIVAINKDENAPIFEVADYGLVADLFEVLPELEKKL
ncbi:MAG: electron transfer flavoprotein subunit alpha/FixB family protein [Alphaproteobacteria bacterium]|nr:electron transfer flavoprotein subunit alpha/FixB family protein [Alphaproteobacteria bacterium]